MKAYNYVKNQVRIKHMSKKLKQIPKKNKGLAKLPKKVRNKMGYMKTGGIVNGEKKKYHKGCGAVMAGRRKQTKYR